MHRTLGSVTLFTGIPGGAGRTSPVSALWKDRREQFPVHAEPPHDATRVQVENVNPLNGPQNTRVRFHLPEEANLDTLKVDLAEDSRLVTVYFDRKLPAGRSIPVERARDA